MGFGAQPPRRNNVNYDNALGLICALALTAYLVYALIRPEKL